MSLSIPPNGLLSLEPGVHEIASPISVMNRAAVIRGSGEGITILRKTTPGPAIFATYDQFYQGHVEVTGLTIVPFGANTDYAIKVQYPRAESIAQKCGVFRDLTIRSNGWIDAGWSGGLALTGCWYVEIENVLINGGLSQPIRGGSRGVSLYGRGAVIHHTNVNVNSMEIGFEAYRAEMQGLYYDRCSVVRGDRVLWINNDPTKPQQPQVVVDGMHGNTRLSGVTVNRQPQSSFSNCLLYHTEGSTDPYVGLDLQEGSDYCHVANFETVQNGTGRCWGIACATLANTFEGVTGQALDSALYFSPQARDNRYGQVTGEGCQELVVDKGVNNREK